MTPTNVRTRGRRRGSLRIPLIMVASLSVAMTALLIWGICLLRQGILWEETPQTTEPIQQTQQTEPSATEPPETTPAERVAQFAQEHGLTMEDYPERLVALLERCPEAEEFVLNYPLEYGKDHAVDISGHANDEGVPLFLQWDMQWGYKDYVGSIAGLSGCGPTCLSMVTYHFTRDPRMHPAYMMDFAESDPSYANETVATQWALFSQGAKRLGLTVTELTGEQIGNEDKLAQVLSDGKVVIINVGPGVFTQIGHYIVVCGYEDGKFQINDPNSPANSQKRWEFGEFADQIKMGWAFSG